MFTGGVSVMLNRKKPNVLIAAFYLDVLKKQDGAMKLLNKHFLKWLVQLCFLFWEPHVTNEMEKY